MKKKKPHSKRLLTRKETFFFLGWQSGVYKDTDRMAQWKWEALERKLRQRVLEEVPKSHILDALYDYWEEDSEIVDGFLSLLGVEIPQKVMPLKGSQRERWSYGKEGGDEELENSSE